VVFPTVDWALVTKLTAWQIAGVNNNNIRSSTQSLAFMANPFSHTTRSLTSDTSRYAFLIWGMVMAMLGVWLAWFLLAQVTVYEVSQAARVEVERAAHAVTAPVAGKITSSSLRLGKRVEAGEVLVELDARTERLRLQEEEARLKALPAQLAALTRQIVDEEQAGERGLAASASAIAQARSRHRESLSAVQFAEEHLRRVALLRAAGQIAEIEMLRARAEADKARSAADALSSEINRLTSDGQSKGHEKHAVAEALRREAASLNGQIELSAATIALLREDIEKHVIRAPVSGEIGAAAPLDTGAFVDTGGIVGSVIPSGTLKVVADFAPARVLGRVHPGQTARMRLDGFPWAQFGSIGVKVDRVAREIRDGHVRVEFLPDSQADSNLLLQHGLPGAVEIEIEQTTPAVLALRAAGQMLTRPVQQSGQVARAGT
jgi:membrane fusion protein, adhesin transport system